jgi:predicted aminopeptidase
VRAARQALWLALVALQTGCWTTAYLSQQGVGQLRMMHSRRRITEVLGDPGVNEELKRRLRLAVAARTFGIEVLGLRGGDAYTRFVDLHGRPLAWNVWAAPKDQLKAVRHHFAIAGDVPYLGYFRERDARREEARLRARGLDTFIGEVSGYSTLGVTSDPVFSSMLEGSDAHIVEVVLHEMLHGTLYLAGHSAWNESLATFVGLHGAALFFRATAGEAGAREVFAEAAARERQSERFSQFLDPVLKELEALYASPRSRDEKLRLREAVFTRAQRRYLELFPPKPGKPPGAFAREPLNNALLVANATYHRATPEHERILARLGGDLAAFVRLYKHAVNDEDDPLDYLKRYALARTK